ncbi:MAG: BatD family protein [Pseudobdellovibrio sp.]
MKKIGNFLACIVLLFYSVLISAAELTAQVKASLDRDQMGIGDSFTLTVVVQSNEDFDDPEIKLPTLSGIELINSWSDGKSSSTRMSFVNGKSEYSKSVQQAFHFMLSPQKEGRLIIPVIDIPIQGKTFKTQPLQIEVGEKFRGRGNQQQKKNGKMILPPGSGDDQNDPFGDENDIFSQLLKEKEKIFEQMRRGGGGGLPGGLGGPRQPIQQRQLDINTNEAFFIYLDVDQKEVYEGQQITANWYIYVKGQIESLDRAKFPDLKGFWKEIIEEVPSLQFSPEIVNGVNYQKALLASHALFPIKAGTAVIDEFKIKARTRSLTQFGWGESHEWTKASKRVAIKVLPLPTENKPKTFSGAVGSFQVQIKTEGLQFPSNQPFSLKVRFEGSGNAKLIDLPSIQWPDGLEVFDTKSDAKFYKNGQSYKEFEVLLIPRKEGEITIPALEISHFDPEQKQYITKTTEPLVLTITKGSAAGIVNPNPNYNGTGSATNSNITDAKNTPFQAQAQFEVPAASFVSLMAMRIAYLSLFSVMMIGVLIYFYQQFNLLNHGPMLHLLIAKKIKILHQLLSDKDYRHVGAEGVNLIYVLAAYLSGQKTANHEWASLVETIPIKFKDKFLTQLTASFEYFQLLGFAPEVVQKNIIESNTTVSELEKLSKLASAIDADLKASDTY